MRHAKGHVFYRVGEGVVGRPRGPWVAVAAAIAAVFLGMEQQQWAVFVREGYGDIVTMNESVRAVPRQRKSPPAYRVLGSRPIYESRKRKKSERGSDGRMDKNIRAKERPGKSKI